MKVSKKYLPLIPLPILIFIAFYGIISSDLDFKAFSSEYQLVSIEDSFRMEVAEIVFPPIDNYRDNPHSAFLILSDGQKVKVSVGYELTHKLKLADVLGVGDSLIKTKTSKFLLVQ